MTNISDFMKGITDYFGEFQNETVQDFFTDELARVKPSDYDRLFRNIITHYPATWHPDVKALNDAISALHLNLLEPVSDYQCPVCGKTGTMRGGVCLVCKYSPASDGNPDKYRAWLNAWKQNRVQHYSVSNLGEIGHVYDKASRSFSNQPDSKSINHAK